VVFILSASYDVTLHTKLQYNFKWLLYLFFFVLHAKPKIIYKKYYVNLWDLAEKDRRF